jgi:hypothetical protein
VSDTPGYDHNHTLDCTCYDPPQHADLEAVVDEAITAWWGSLDPRPTLPQAIVQAITSGGWKAYFVCPGCGCSIIHMDDCEAPPMTAQWPDLLVKVALELGCEALVEALVWEVTMGHTTVTPPLSVQQTLNGIRVHAGLAALPLRAEDGALIDGEVDA